MKKVLLVIALLNVLLMTGCNRDIKNNESKNILQEIEKFNISTETDEVSTVEVKGVKYRDINSIPNIEFDFDSSLVYADTIKDGEELYVKLSDSFVIDEANVSKNNENSNKKLILPSKIYSSEENVNYLYNYNGEVYYIPTEKCALGEEKIVYRDYNIELIKDGDCIKINGVVSNDVISGWDISDYDGELRYDDVSLCEAYMESWKISEKVLNSYNELALEDYISNRGIYTNIYQVDFDDDENTLEFIYTSNIEDHVHIDSSYPTYTLITYSNKNGVKNYNDLYLRMLWFNNIKNFKNVFYGYDAFEINDIDNTFCTNEKVITGYYVYDKDDGFTYVKRFANGLKVDENGFSELSKVALTLSDKHIIKEDENGKKYIDAFPMYDIEYLYDEDGNIVINEDGSYKENPNSRYIEAGTKIYINYISKDGYLIEFKTEDGIEYTIDYYYT